MYPLYKKKVKKEQKNMIGIYIADDNKWAIDIGFSALLAADRYPLKSEHHKLIKIHTLLPSHAILSNFQSLTTNRIF